MYSGSFWLVTVLWFRSWVAVGVVLIMKSRWISVRNIVERGLKAEVLASLRALRGWPAWILVFAVVVNILFVLMDNLPE